MPSPVRMRRLWDTEQWLDFAFDTFTAAMAKRATSVFAASPIMQGHLSDDTANPDHLTAPVGAQFGNPTGLTYSNLDGYQGSVVFWITPEWDGNDGLNHYVIYNDVLRVWKKADDNLEGGYHDDSSWKTITTSAAGWTAGTRYFVVLRWDAKNTLDGTNRVCLSVNGAHTYGMTSVSGTIKQPTTTTYLGYHNANLYPANAIVEGLTIYRRPLYDSNGCGVPATFDASGPVDEIAAIHAAGAGQDPCLVTGSWDVVFCLPTDATEGALVTGTGNAWSHPHTSDVLDHWTLEDGYYGGGQWAVGFNGTSTLINCGSAAALDDLGAGGAQFTVDGWFRQDGGTAQVVIGKGYTGGIGGWLIMVDASSQIQFRVDLVTTDVNITWTDYPIDDGKWHHVACHYDDATKTGRIAVDGVWGSTSVGAGNYVTDAANDLIIGRRSTSAIWYFTGAIGWLRLSNNDRHTAGTDFIPPREFPAADGNTVEAWSLNDGTGATAVAQVTTPGNDGTITAGTWEQQWDDVLTPVYPTSLEFDGSATYINCGSGATLDDLPNGAILTVDGWVRLDSPSGSCTLLHKGTFLTSGWRLYASSNLVVFRVELATADAAATAPLIADGKWHHITAYYSDATKTARVAVDGCWSNATVGNGAYQLDAAANLHIGRRSDGASDWWEGALAWQRLSNSDRYGGATGATFVPPDRVNPPAPDGNTVEQWNLQDGAGTTAVAQVTSPGNDGAITMGSGRWWNSPDMVSDSPGSRVYPWGYAIGSDGAGDGVHQHQAGLSAGENYVVRVPLRYEADKRAQPRIEIYDETNGASISQFDGPFLTGTHDGGAAQASLSDSSAPYWPYSLVGGTVYNITNGESATITAAGNSIVGALSGSETWDNGDVYFIVPPARWVFVEPFCFELPTIARNGAAADCTEISVRLLNQAGEGVVYWLQAELLENLVDNPSLETGAGNPWIPDGWLNGGLGAGESVQELVIVHSGSSSIEFIAASTGDYLYPNSIDTNTGMFYMAGVWHYGDDASFVALRSTNVNELHLQYDPSALDWPTAIDAAWLPHAIGVYRQLLADKRRPGFRTDSGASGLRYIDDYYIIELDDVSLTVTPASQANSLENTGLRIDGRDLCTRYPPAGVLTTLKGCIRFKWTPRHSAAILVGFGNTAPEIVNAYGNANNKVEVVVAAANTIRLNVTANGANAWMNWDCTGLIDAGTTYHVQVCWDGGWFRLLVDGVLRAQVSPGALSLAPATVYWGSFTSGWQIDATYARA